MAHLVGVAGSDRIAAHSASPAPMSLRDYLEHLREGRRLLTVRREVDPRFELNAVVRKIQSGPNLPVLFEKVRGTAHRVISNTLGDYSRIAGLLHVEVNELARTWAERMSAPVPAELEQAEATALHEISLKAIPHITFAEKDAGPYLTSSVVVARDPQSGVVNLSYHRMQIVSDKELRCRLSTSGDLFRIQQIAESQSRALPVVVAIGLPPIVGLAAAATAGPMVSEYDVAARLAGCRFATQPSPLSGLPVPVSTELLIEGELLAHERRPEGPFGEWMDYYVPRTDNHVLVVKKVFARPDALFHAVSAGSKEELAMSCAPIAGLIFHSVRTWVPGLEDVTCFPHPQICVLKVRNAADGLARKAILAAFGAEMNRMLYCVAVDEDVDIHDWQDVLWAMSTRCRADRDIFQIPDIPSFARDPHRMHWGRLGVDATKPAEHAEAFERKRVPGLRTIELADYLD